MSPEPTNVIQRFPEGRPLEAGRWCTYKQLRAAVAAAKLANFNRQLPAHIVRRLDPQGINTFHFFMLHEHIDGVKIRHPHVRAISYIKLRGQQQAHGWDGDLMLDIPLTSWDHWKSADER
jgi:hypothetical protein